MTLTERYRRPADLPPRIPVFPLRGAILLPRATFIAIADPNEFARLGIGAKELRLHLALGSDHPADEAVKKGAPGGGLGKDDALSHMVVLTDARQIDRRLLDIVARAAVIVNG